MSGLTYNLIQTSTSINSNYISWSDIEQLCNQASLPGNYCCLLLTIGPSPRSKKGWWLMCTMDGNRYCITKDHIVMTPEYKHEIKPCAVLIIAI